MPTSRSTCVCMCDVFMRTCAAPRRDVVFPQINDHMHIHKALCARAYTYIHIHSSYSLSVRRRNVVEPQINMAQFHCWAALEHVSRTWVMCVHMYVCMHVCIYTRTSINIPLHAYTQFCMDRFIILIYIYIYIYIYTHTHTHIQAQLDEDIHTYPA